MTVFGENSSKFTVLPIGTRVHSMVYLVKEWYEFLLLIATVFVEDIGPENKKDRPFI